ncbi:hypothetical protein V6N11_023935 [Hibiscus sabdariffa]|uniref:Uncharacterized protein n=1 Tax=Hibiscus sabdariffa TaxID=183260 RepID=A0ABR2TPM0_9ROSI
MATIDRLPTKNKLISFGRFVFTRQSLSCHVEHRACCVVFFSLSWLWWNFGFMRVVFLGPLEGFGDDHGESNGNKGGIETFIEAMWSNGLALDGMSRKSFIIAW